MTAALIFDNLCFTYELNSPRLQLLFRNSTTALNFHLFTQCRRFHRQHIPQCRDRSNPSSRICAKHEDKKVRKLKPHHIQTEMWHLPNKITISGRDTIRAVTNARRIMANVHVVGSIIATKFVRGAEVSTFRTGRADAASFDLRTRIKHSFSCERMALNGN